MYASELLLAGQRNVVQANQRDALVFRAGSAFGQHAADDGDFNADLRGQFQHRINRTACRNYVI